MAKLISQPDCSNHHIPIAVTKIWPTRCLIKMQTTVSLHRGTRFHAGLSCPLRHAQKRVPYRDTKMTPKWANTSGHALAVVSV